MKAGKANRLFRTLQSLCQFTITFKVGSRGIEPLTTRLIVDNQFQPACCQAKNEIDVFVLYH